MLYTYPDYYREFHCTADACEDTCCAGWQICIDENALRRYRKVEGDYRQKVRHSIDWRRKMFRQTKDKRCAFLTEDNLCDMYRVLGEQSLCKTCRLYPRHIEEFEGVREISLSVSCPEVAKMLLTRTEPVRFCEVEKPGEEEYEDFDPFLYSLLLDARDIIFRILQDRSLTNTNLPIETRILMMLGIAWDAQRRVNKGELFACEEAFEKYRNGSVGKTAEKKRLAYEKDEECNFRFMKRNFDNLYELELLKEDWYILLKETEDCLYQQGSSTYHKLKTEFRQWLTDSPIDWEMMVQQLCVYYIYTYFCGSVYDGRIFAQAQMATAYVAMIGEMLTARWYINNKSLEMEDMIEITYRFSRELEHSDKNLMTWEGLLEKQTRFWLR